MPIEVQNDPLSGAEIKDIILQRVADALDRDSTLANDVAYAGFTTSFEVKIKYLRSQTPETVAWGHGAAGEVVSDRADEAVGDEVTGEYATDIPNEARVAHDLPVPALQPTPNGKKKVRLHLNRAQAGLSPTPAAAGGK